LRCRIYEFAIFGDIAVDSWHWGICTLFCRFRLAFGNDADSQQADAPHADSSENSKICEKELGVAGAALDNWREPHRKSKEFLLGMLLPTAMGSGLIADSMSGPKGDVSPWLQVCGPDPFPTRTDQEVAKAEADLEHGDSSDEWSRCKNEVATAYWLLAMRESAKIEAVSGMTYYVRWSATGSGGKMNLVDGPIGAKNLRGLHPVKE
jgi:hypothetical protein